jgi:hypothetical protein
MTLSFSLSETNPKLLVVLSLSLILQDKLLLVCLSVVWVLLFEEVAKRYIHYYISISNVSNLIRIYQVIIIQLPAYFCS